MLSLYVAALTAMTSAQTVAADLENTKPSSQTITSRTNTPDASLNAEHLPSIYLKEGYDWQDWTDSVFRYKEDIANNKGLRAALDDIERYEYDSENFLAFDKKNEVGDVTEYGVISTFCHVVDPIAQEAVALHIGLIQLITDKYLPVYEPKNNPSLTGDAKKLNELKIQFLEEMVEALTDRNKLLVGISTDLEILFFYNLCSEQYDNVISNDKSDNRNGTEIYNWPNFDAAIMQECDGAEDFFKDTTFKTSRRFREDSYERQQYESRLYYVESELFKICSDFKKFYSKRISNVQDFLTRKDKLNMLICRNAFLINYFARLTPDTLQEVISFSIFQGQKCTSSEFKTKKVDELSKEELDKYIIDLYKVGVLDKFNHINISIARVFNRLLRIVMERETL